MTRTVALLLFAVSLPSAGRAIELSGRVGLDYTRDDIWAYQADRLTLPSLDLNLRFDVAGYLARPDIAQYFAGLNYERLTWDLPGGKRESDQLGYRGRLVLLKGPRNPFQLNLEASRSHDTLSTEGLVGELKTVTTVWSADARLTLPDRPALTLGYSRLTSERTGGLIPDSDRTIQSVTGAVVEGAGNVGYNARYVGNYSDGTYATDHYDDHRIDVAARATLSRDWIVSLSDNYYRRVPTLTAAVNPGQEFNAFGAQVLNRIGSDGSQTFDYRYTHGLQGSGVGSDVERTSQRLDYSTIRFLSRPEWRILGAAGLSYLQNRVAGDQTAYLAETAGATLYWRPPGTGRFLELHGGGTLGLVQAPDEDPLFGAGVLAGVTWERRFDPVTVRADYGVAFQNDLREEGQALTQTVTLAANRPLYTGVITGNVMASAARLDGPLLGLRAARSVNAGVTYAWHAYSVGLQGSVSDSVNPSLDEGLAGDGLVLAPYDTHSRQLTLTGTASVARRTRLTGLARYSSADMPDRPSVSGYEARAGLEFDLGALRLAIEDRYVTAETEGRTNRINQLMVHFYRAFGASY